MGKPTPKVEVMKFLKEKNYVDAKNNAGECEAVVMIAKGQGTIACLVNNHLCNSFCSLLLSFIAR